jgi:hypothetical protein
LTQAGIPFLFDQGGFEHPSFGGTRKYFDEFAEQRADLNVWDYGTTEADRPYYHIQHAEDHVKIADYYYKNITQHFDE